MLYYHSLMLVAVSTQCNLEVKHQQYKQLSKAGQGSEVMLYKRRRTMFGFLIQSWITGFQILCRSESGLEKKL